MSKYKQLDEYIKKSRAEGKTDEVLRIEMIQGGYNQEDIKRVLKPKNRKWISISGTIYGLIYFSSAIYLWLDYLRCIDQDQIFCRMIIFFVAMPAFYVYFVNQINYIPLSIYFFTSVFLITTFIYLICYGVEKLLRKIFRVD